MGMGLGMGTQCRALVARHRLYGKKSHINVLQTCLLTLGVALTYRSFNSFLSFITKSYALLCALLLKIGYLFMSYTTTLGSIKGVTTLDGSDSHLCVEVGLGQLTHQS